MKLRTSVTAADRGPVWWADRRGLIRHTSNLALAGTLLLATRLVLACATCGCTLSYDGAMGYSSSTGWRINVEYDFINQDQLRSGTSAVSTVPNGTELEHQTINRYLSLGVSYSPSADWNGFLWVPYVMRSHTTYGTYDSSEPLPPLSGSSSSSLGDAKLIGTYRGILSSHNLGIQLGVKLPTGAYYDSVKFSTGPMAGEPLDASLQPGTGSTDMIVGAYYYQAVSKNWDIYANGSYQAAVAEKLDQPGNDYRPGNLVTVSFGVRYQADPTWVPQLQVNLSRKMADQGALADTADTAGTVAYLSPGLSINLSHSMQLYGFVQLPVYSNLSGYQLFPHWTASVGASYSF